ncbi:MAG: hypothetical protein ACI93T_000517 [Porticoccaceae bacterium]|jgi:hypothetical protein
MSDSFDPYYIWLGIPPKDQPPNHYRLLGLQELEENTDVIDAAANRQTTYLHEMAAGPNRKESQQLLNEVAAARRCLLSPEKKNEYDEKLRADTAAAEAAKAAVAPPVAAAPPVAVPVAQAVAPAVVPAVAPAVPTVAHAVAPGPAINTGGSPVAEIPNFNFADNAAPAAVVDTGAGFPNLDAQPSNPVATTVPQPDAGVPNLPDSDAKPSGKKSVPKQWIIAGCSVVVVAIVAVAMSGGPESKSKSSKPSGTTTKLDGSGAAVTSAVEESPADEPESPVAANEEAPEKKSKPSLFDQVSDQDSFFKVPATFGSQEEKKE